MPSYSVRFNDSKYSVAQNQDASSITHMLTADFFINWPKRLIIENNISYIYNSRIAPGFRKGVTSWNAAANYQLFRNKTGRSSVFHLRYTAAEYECEQDHLAELYPGRTGGCSAAILSN